MKKSASIMLILAPVLSTVLFNACGGGEEETTRDVYQNREECLKDWGDQELCQEMNDDDSNEYRRGGGVFYAGRPFWGPGYYPSNRTVVYKGRNIAPAGKSSAMKPFIVTSRSSASSRSSVSSPGRSSSTSFGGFGGRSGGSGSGS